MVDLNRKYLGWSHLLVHEFDNTGQFLWNAIRYEKHSNAA